MVVPMPSIRDEHKLYETPPTPGRSRNMAANRRRDTGPERAVRSLLHGAGFRYRVDYPVVVDGVRIRPDLAFTARRVAVFIDGCFWHCCPEHGSQPASNVRYWGPKLQGNVDRDRRHTRLLQEAGWTVLRFWEHETPERVATEVRHALGDNARPSPAR
jgi:DNA mismatch endonuclease (patch repair protein)